MKDKIKKILNSIPSDIDDVIAYDDETEKTNKEPDYVFVNKELSSPNAEYKIIWDVKDSRGISLSG